MLAILLLAAEKHKATFIAPIGIGLALFVRAAQPPRRAHNLTTLGRRAFGCLLHWRISQPRPIFRP